ITLAGAPAQIGRGGRSLVTTEFAPITQRSPTVTPVVTKQPKPNQQFDPILVGPFDVNPCHVTGVSGSSKRCDASETKQPLANITWSPIVTSFRQATIVPMLRKQPSPMRTRPEAATVIQQLGSSSAARPQARPP